MKIIKAINILISNNYRDLSQKDIFNLKSYIDGWILRESLINDPIKFNCFFESWINKKYSLSTGPFSWAKIIRLHEAEPLNSFSSFFEEFCNDENWKIVNEPVQSDDINIYNQSEFRLINTAIEKTNSIEQLINIISKRPEMYVMPSTIWCLKSLLNGWIANSPDTVIDQFLLIHFEEYLNNTFFKGKNTSFPYDQVLSFYSLNDIDATKLFFEEFSLYLTCI
jgi:hypothetical protein